MLSAALTHKRAQAGFRYRRALDVVLPLERVAFSAHNLNSVLLLAFRFISISAQHGKWPAVTSCQTVKLYFTSFSAIKPGESIFISRVSWSVAIVATYLNSCMHICTYIYTVNNLLPITSVIKLIIILRIWGGKSMQYLHTVIPQIY